MTAADLSRAAWRKSSFSGGANGGTVGECVEVAALDNGLVAVRNSNHPDRGVVVFTRPEMTAWIQGVKAGEFDDLT